MCLGKKWDVILFRSLPASIFKGDITLVMNSYWIDSLLTATLRFNSSASSSGTKQARCCHYCCHNMFLIHICPGFALAMMFFHRIHLEKADRQQLWVRWYEFVQVINVLHLTELNSSSLLNCIASPKIYLLDVVWLLL